MFIHILEHYLAFTEDELDPFYIHNVNSKLQDGMHSVILIVANSVYKWQIHTYLYVLCGQELYWKLLMWDVSAEMRSKGETVSFISFYGI